MKIPFNKPFLSGNEITYIQEAVLKGQISGNGFFTKKCQELFQTLFGFEKCLLTNSCTAALEMSALLLDIKIGDEIILPSYTFVSVANAFMLRGATLIFADSEKDSPHIDPVSIRSLITERTKAIVIVHYGGIACKIGAIMEIVKNNKIYLIEDAAHAIDADYLDQPLGSFGHLATFSFHETKNIISGEGGMLVVNDPKLQERAEIIWEKGTNRNAFFKGEVNKYEWVDIGSSFLPSELQAAFLLAQLENIQNIQKRRLEIWHRYHDNLIKISEDGYFRIPEIPDYTTHNGHIFYLIMDDIALRDGFISYMKTKGILVVFHYLPLHLSPYFRKKYTGKSLPNSILFSECLVRLPLYYDLSALDQSYVCDNIHAFFLQNI